MPYVEHSQKETEARIEASSINDAALELMNRWVLLQQGSPIEKLEQMQGLSWFCDAVVKKYGLGDVINHLTKEAMESQKGELLAVAAIIARNEMIAGLLKSKCSSCSCSCFDSNK